jgi:uncharacterized protein involved in cysteine biosynthesis
VNWSFWLLLIPTMAYTMAAAVYCTKGNYPLTIVYFGYAFANCGLLWLDRLMSK